MIEVVHVNDWLRDNADLVNHGSKKDIILKAFDDVIYNEFKDLLYKMLEVDVISYEDILDAYCSRLAEESENFKRTSRSTSEARLNWLVDFLGYWPGVTPKSITGYLLKNHQKYGLKMIPLPDMYAWSDNKEYDLGWFDSKKFKTYTS